MEDKFKCLSCGESKEIRDYYKSYDKKNNLGIVPYCKICLNNMIRNENGIVDINKVYETLKLINRPYVHNLWLTSQDNSNVFGTYMKNLGMRQYRELIWTDSEFETKKEIQERINDKSDITYNLEELENKWGVYPPDELIAFEKKYDKLIKNYGEKTELHTENLLTYIRFRVKEEMATSRNDVKEAKEWGALASKAAQDAKINVSQLSKSDISGGVDVICQLFEAVESEIGIIPLLPKLLEKPQDEADLIIWVLINYYRRLEDKPRITYKEVWNFYDEMLEEYFIQQAWDKDKIEQFMNNRHKYFRDLEKVYKEPIYEDGES